MVVGLPPRRRNPEKSRVLFSNHNLSNLYLKILKTSFSVRIGIQRWEFHTKEVIYCMVLLVQARVLLPKLLQPKSIIQYVLSIVLIRLTILTSIVYLILHQRNLSF